MSRVKLESGEVLDLSPQRNHRGELLLRGTKKRRRTAYSYEHGTVTTSCTPLKLKTRAEEALAAFLVSQVSMTEAARLLQCGVPTVRRAVRAYYWRQHHA